MAAKPKAVPCSEVGAHFQGHVDNAPGFQPYSARRIFLDVEFLNRVDGKDGRGVPGNARPVDNACPSKVRLLNKPS